MTKSTVVAYVDPETVKAMDVLRRQKGWTKSYFVEMALKSYLGDLEIESEETPEDIRIVGGKKYRKSKTRTGDYAWKLLEES